MDILASFKELYQEHISIDDLNILHDFYSCIKNSGKYAKMIAFVYENSTDSNYFRKQMQSFLHLFTKIVQVRTIMLFPILFTN